MAKRRWMWVSLALTLLLGMGLGVLLERLVLHPWSREGEEGTRSRPGLAERLTSDLSLSPEQRQSLDELLASRRGRVDAFWAEFRSNHAQLRQELRDAIRKLLTPEQEKRYDEILAREDARREKEERNRRR